MPDKIKITVLEDGTIRTETDRVSAINHNNATQFLHEIAKLAGGPVTERHKHGKHGQAHSHGIGEHHHH